MPRRFQNCDPYLARAHFKAVAHLDVRDLGASVGPDVDLGPGARRQLLVPRHEVGVQVGLKDVLDLHALLLGGSQVNVHISLGIDHNRLAFRGQHVGIESQTTQVKLFEVHSPPPFKGPVAQSVSLLH